ncbi:AraC family transcriptional regulator [Amycolatopsis vancoresmycina DSM 44592]|uniref:AraC family transcriptional regulator n=1 Tax=Amycolatopsis vancoresmycina DSM 44592 TaxID=1292037 RepID=R1ID76_9PSEU|nr:AraC family transcriptional regulator [Amycolatopsis vancoresmycina DSM 44592]
MRRQLAALVGVAGRPVPGLGHGLTHLFPSARMLAGADLSGARLSAATERTLRAFAAAVAADETLLEPGASLAGCTAALTAVPGIEPGTAQEIALRLGHADAFPATERTLGKTVLDPDAGRPAAAWHPWRAFAATHLITAGVSTSDG